jgi:hydrogenase nickel incorporation protein HypA/HybF
MHEQGIARSLLDSVVDHARREGAKRVLKIVAEAGPLSESSRLAVEFHLELLSRGTLAEGAQIEVKTWSPLCPRCERQVEPWGTDFICPECGSPVPSSHGGERLGLECVEIE